MVTKATATSFDGFYTVPGITVLGTEWLLSKHQLSGQPHLALVGKMASEKYCLI